MIYTKKIVFYTVKLAVAMNVFIIFEKFLIQEKKIKLPVNIQNSLFFNKKNITLNHEGVNEHV